MSDFRYRRVWVDRFGRRPRAAQRGPRGRRARALRRVGPAHRRRPARTSPQGTSTTRRPREGGGRVRRRDPSRVRSTRWPSAGDFAVAAAADRRAVEAMGGALAGSDRPFVLASGLIGLQTTTTATEDDGLVPSDELRASPAGGRAATALLTLSLRGIGVRSSVLRFPPTVHGDGDHGFVAMLVDTARARGERVRGGWDQPLAGRAPLGRGQAARASPWRRPRPARSSTPWATRASPSRASPRRSAATSGSGRSPSRPAMPSSTSASSVPSPGRMSRPPRRSRRSCSVGSRRARGCSTTSSRGTTSARRRSSGPLRPSRPTINSAARARRNDESARGVRAG